MSKYVCVSHAHQKNPAGAEAAEKKKWANVDRFRYIHTYSSAQTHASENGNIYM